MGWDELDGNAEEAFRRTEGAARGRQPHDRHRGTSPFGAFGYNPQGIRIGQDKGRNKSAVKVWDQRAYKDYATYSRKELGTARNIKGRAAPAAPLRARGLGDGAWTSTTPSTARRPTPDSWTSRWCPAAQQGEGVAADGCRRHHGRAHPPRGGTFSAAKTESSTLSLLLPQLRLPTSLEEQPTPLQ